MINPDLKNCFLKLAVIMEKCGVSCYRNSANLIEQNPDLAEITLDIRKFCVYMLEWLAVVAPELSEKDKIIFVHCGEYLNSTAGANNERC